MKQITSLENWFQKIDLGALRKYLLTILVFGLFEGSYTDKLPCQSWSPYLTDVKCSALQQKLFHVVVICKFCLKLNSLDSGHDDWTNWPAFHLFKLLVSCMKPFENWISIHVLRNKRPMHEKDWTAISNTTNQTVAKIHGQHTDHISRRGLRMVVSIH